MSNSENLQLNNPSLGYGGQESLDSLFDISNASENIEPTTDPSELTALFMGSDSTDLEKVGAAKNLPQNASTSETLKYVSNYGSSIADTDDEYLASLLDEESTSAVKSDEDSMDDMFADIFGSANSFLNQLGEIPTQTTESVEELESENETEQNTMDLGVGSDDFFLRLQTGRATVNSVDEFADVFEESEDEDIETEDEEEYDEAQGIDEEDWFAEEEDDGLTEDNDEDDVEALFDSDIEEDSDLLEEVDLTDEMVTPFENNKDGTELEEVESEEVSIADIFGSTAEEVESEQNISIQDIFGGTIETSLENTEMEGINNEYGKSENQGNNFEVDMLEANGQMGTNKATPAVEFNEEVMGDEENTEELLLVDDNTDDLEEFSEEGTDSSMDDIDDFSDSFEDNDSEVEFDEIVEEGSDEDDFGDVFEDDLSEDDNSEDDFEKDSSEDDFEEDNSEDDFEEDNSEDDFEEDNSEDDFEEDNSEDDFEEDNFEDDFEEDSSEDDFEEDSSEDNFEDDFEEDGFGGDFEEDETDMEEDSEEDFDADVAESSDENDYDNTVSEDDFSDAFEDDSNSAELVESPEEVSNDDFEEAFSEDDMEESDGFFEEQEDETDDSFTETVKSNASSITTEVTDNAPAQNTAIQDLSLKGKVNITAFGIVHVYTMQELRLQGCNILKES